jgi:AcrR family transcriptional regulator
MMGAKRKRNSMLSASTEERLLEAVKAAGLAEGTLYNHFRDKDEIFMAVLQRKVGEFAHAIQDLPLRVGQATILDNLRPVAEAAAGFHIKVAPLVCSLLADQKLLAETRGRMQERRVGPQRSLESLAAYIGAEQRLGRITSEVDAATVAGLILGTSFHMAVLDHFSGHPPDERQSRGRMQRAIQALVIGLTPRAEMS